MTDAPVLSDLPALSGGSDAGSSIISAPPGSGDASGGISSGTASVQDGTVIISDAPPADSSSSGTAGNVSESVSAGITAGQAPASSGSSSVGDAPGSGTGDASGITAAPDAGSTDTVTGKAPEPVSSAAVQAPAAAVSVATEETAGNAAAVSGPTSGKSAAAGSVYANSAVTRVSLDFSLITPNHSKGVLNVARASVRQTDGSWQNFDYSDNIHFAFYKMKESRTDSNGVLWYVAGVNAYRFGDTYSNDGERKTELWLNSADCIVRNTIDVSTTNPKRIAIVKAALASLGKQYVYGGNGPDAFDCSGLVKSVCKEAGITVPRTSTQLLQLSGQITAAELRPGDLMVRAGHCGIYIGNGIFVHASDSSVGVVAEYLSVYNLSNKFTNFVNVVGD